MSIDRHPILLEKEWPTKVFMVLRRSHGPAAFKPEPRAFDGHRIAIESQFFDQEESSVTLRLALLVATLVVFVIYSFAVALNAGFTGFLTVAANEPWGGQMLIDLVIALGLFLIWMHGDSREQGIPELPYLILTLTTGSIGALAYLVHRTAKQAGPV